ncbi:uncharacterized protein L203_101430 [Cryptococcus depauperatus CBS 7841]|uniref:Uncharacterized protein n=1 Tax=Cryptococcus depauperatus CBS 7841 TaxID=1295531 RepID=A0A1E3IU33_9TREE|nr:hypothetical protein L203_01210 [Cryptococcus depauperatus CBS 7841]
MPFKARCNPASLLQRKNAQLAFKNTRQVYSRSTLTPRYLLPIRRNHSRQVRCSSTSSLLSPFTALFSRNRLETPETAAGSFVDALTSRSVEGLKKSYDTIIKQPQPSQYLSEEMLLKAVEILAGSTSETPKALYLLRRIYNDLNSCFGYAIQVKHQQAMICGYCTYGLVKEALLVAVAMDPRSVDWRLILHASANVDASICNVVVKCFRRMATAAPEDYAMILQVLFSDPDRSHISLETLLEEMGEQGMLSNRTIQAALLRAYISLGLFEKAQQIIDGWNLSTTENIEPPMWEAAVFYYIAINDVPKLQTIVANMSGIGYEVPQDAILALALDNINRSINSRSKVLYPEMITAIELAEHMCKSIASGRVWAKMIEGYLLRVKNRDSVEVALQLYEESQGRGLPRDIELASTLIIALCSSRKQGRLEDALRIYDDFMGVASEVDLMQATVRSHLAIIYEKLLIACARTHPPPMASVIRLLNDMRALSLDFTSINLTSLLILLMRASPDHTAAYNVYSHFYALNSTAIGRLGFSAILTTFLSLSWKNSLYPPSDLFISMMKDMNRAGYTPDSYILSALLKQYGLLAIRIRRQKTLGCEETIASLAHSISKIHTLIKLDPIISPDVPLLTALMDAYNKVGCFSEAFGVWDELVQRRAREPPENVQQVYSASVNVILDACGWSYSLHKARKAWGWARKWALVWEKKHWDAWIECLCRCGELEEACRVACVEMGSGKVPRPDKDTIRLLCKFGRRDSERGRKVQEVERVMGEIRKKWPEWWEELSTEKDPRVRKRYSGV